MVAIMVVSAIDRPVAPGAPSRAVHAAAAPAPAAASAEAATSASAATATAQSSSLRCFLGCQARSSCRSGRPLLPFRGGQHLPSEHSAVSGDDMRRVKSLGVQRSSRRLLSSNRSLRYLLPHGCFAPGCFALCQFNLNSMLLPVAKHSQGARLQCLQSN